MKTPEHEDLSVYIAGETVPGTDIGLSYIYIKTPLGPVRMTGDEAETLSRLLEGAALTLGGIEAGDE
jgi:hypothetical protein